ncbi:MAG: hypothetical protein QOF02_126 [Blastocatellia bacterium]|jgi:hypothetical protein|nr:hypothetical protein [Blastocatellia bacterium]
MRKVVVLALLICSLAFAARAAERDGFTIALSLIIGERSRDSHAETTNIRLEGDKLTYEQTYSGAGASKRKSEHLEFKLKSGEVERLKSLVKEQKLTGTGSLRFEPAAGQFNYFELNIKVTLRGIIATQELSGPRGAANIKDERVYQKSVALLRELYRLINLRDKEISYQEPAG